MAEHCNCSSDDGCLPWPLAFVVVALIAWGALSEWRDAGDEARLKDRIVAECAGEENPGRCADQIEGGTRVTRPSWSLGEWTVFAAAVTVAAAGFVGLLVWSRTVFGLAVAFTVVGVACWRLPNRALRAELEAALRRKDTAVEAAMDTAFELQRVSGEHEPVELYDQDTDESLPRWESTVGFGMHVSRGWNDDPFAPDCGCDIAPCGLVVARAGCLQHDNGKTIRQAHPTSECPAFQPVRAWADAVHGGPRTAPGSER